MKPEHENDRLKIESFKEISSIHPSSETGGVFKLVHVTDGLVTTRTLVCEKNIFVVGRFLNREKGIAHLTFKVACCAARIRLELNVLCRMSVAMNKHSLVAHTHAESTHQQRMIRIGCFDENVKVVVFAACTSVKKISFWRTRARARILEMAAAPRLPFLLLLFVDWLSPTCFITHFCGGHLKWVEACVYKSHL